MAELKTRKNDADVGVFLDGIENEKRRDDCRTVVELMADVTGERAAMWGDSLIGFGSYHYKYPTTRPAARATGWRSASLRASRT